MPNASNQTMPDTTIFLGVLSSGRLGLLKQCLNSAYANVGPGIVLTGLVVFDDDPEGFANCPKHPWLTKRLLYPRHYTVRAANIIAESMLNLQPAPDFVVLIDDDTEFLQYGWGAAAVEFHTHHFPDSMGIIDFLSPRECCQTMTTPKFLREFLGGQYYDPSYIHCYHDTDLRERVEGYFACATRLYSVDADGTASYPQPVFVHKRDVNAGAMGRFLQLRMLDLKNFQKKGWALHDDQ